MATGKTEGVLWASHGPGPTLCTPNFVPSGKNVCVLQTANWEYERTVHCEKKNDKNDKVNKVELPIFIIFKHHNYVIFGMHVP